jgi:hypothetical protein
MIMDWFYVVSGLRMNKEKTKVLWIGSMKDSVEKIVPNGL